MKKATVMFAAASMAVAGWSTSPVYEETSADDFKGTDRNSTLWNVSVHVGTTVHTGTAVIDDWSALARQVEDSAVLAKFSSYRPGTMIYVR